MYTDSDASMAPRAAAPVCYDVGDDLHIQRVTDTLRGGRVRDVTATLTGQIRDNIEAIVQTRIFQESESRVPRRHRNAYQLQVRNREVYIAFGDGSRVPLIEAASRALRRREDVGTREEARLIFDNAQTIIAKARRLGLVDQSARAAPARAPVMPLVPEEMGPEMVDARGAGRKAQARMRDLERELGAERTRRADAEERAQRASHECDELAARLGETARERDDAVRRLGEVEAALAEATGERDELRAEVSSLRLQVRSLTGALEDAERQVAAARNDEARAREIAAEAEIRARRLAAEADALRSEVGEHDRARMQAVREAEESLRQVVTLRARVEGLTEELVAVRAANAGLSTERDRLRAAHDEANAGTMAAEGRARALEARILELTRNREALLAEAEEGASAATHLRIARSELSELRGALERQAAAMEERAATFETECAAAERRHAEEIEQIQGDAARRIALLFRQLEAAEERVGASSRAIVAAADENAATVRDLRRAESDRDGFARALEEARATFRETIEAVEAGHAETRRELAAQEDALRRQEAMIGALRRDVTAALALAEERGAAIEDVRAESQAREEALTAEFERRLDRAGEESRSIIARLERRLAATTAEAEGRGAAELRGESLARELQAAEERLSAQAARFTHEARETEARFERELARVHATHAEREERLRARLAADTERHAEALALGIAGERELAADEIARTRRELELLREEKGAEIDSLARERTALLEQNRALQAECSALRARLGSTTRESEAFAADLAAERRARLQTVAAFEDEVGAIQRRFQAEVAAAREEYTVARRALLARTHEAEAALAETRDLLAASRDETAAQTAEVAALRRALQERSTAFEERAASIERSFGERRAALEEQLRAAQEEIAAQAEAIQAHERELGRRGAAIEEHERGRASERGAFERELTATRTRLEEAEARFARESATIEAERTAALALLEAERREKSLVDAALLRETRRAERAEAATDEERSGRIADAEEFERALAEARAGYTARIDEAEARHTAAARRAAEGHEAQVTRLTAELREARAQAAAEVERADALAASLTEVTQAADAAAAENTRLERAAAHAAEEITALRSRAEGAERTASAASQRETEIGAALAASEEERAAGARAIRELEGRLEREVSAIRAEAEAAQESEVAMSRRLAAAQREHSGCAEQIRLASLERDENAARAEALAAELRDAEAAVARAEERARGLAATSAEQGEAHTRALGERDAEIDALRAEVRRCRDAQVEAEEQRDELQADIDDRLQTQLERAREEAAALEEELHGLRGRQESLERRAREAEAALEEERAGRAGDREAHSAEMLRRSTHSREEVEALEARLAAREEAFRAREARLVEMLARFRSIETPGDGENLALQFARSGHVVGPHGRMGDVADDPIAGLEAMLHGLEAEFEHQRETIAAFGEERAALVAEFRRREEHLARQCRELELELGSSRNALAAKASALEEAHRDARTAREAAASAGRSERAAARIHRQAHVDRDAAQAQLALLEEQVGILQEELRRVEREAAAERGALKREHAAEKERIAAAYLEDRHSSLELQAGVHKREAATLRERIVALQAEAEQLRSRNQSLAWDQEYNSSLLERERNAGRELVDSLRAAEERTSEAEAALAETRRELEEVRRARESLARQRTEGVDSQVDLLFAFLRATVAQEVDSDASDSDSDGDEEATAASARPARPRATYSGRAFREAFPSLIGALKVRSKDAVRRHLLGDPTLFARVITFLMRSAGERIHADQQVATALRATTGELEAALEQARSEAATAQRELRRALLGMAALADGGDLDRAIGAADAATAAGDGDPVRRVSGVLRERDATIAALRRRVSELTDALEAARRTGSASAGTLALTLRGLQALIEGRDLGEALGDAEASGEADDPLHGVAGELTRLRALNETQRERIEELEMALAASRAAADEVDTSQQSTVTQMERAIQAMAGVRLPPAEAGATPQARMLQLFELLQMRIRAQSTEMAEAARHLEQERSQKEAAEREVAALRPALRRARENAAAADANLAEERRISSDLRGQLSALEQSSRAAIAAAAGDRADEIRAADARAADAEAAAHQARGQATEAAAIAAAANTRADELAARLSETSGQLEPATAALREATARIATLEEENAHLRGDLDAARAEIEELRARLALYEDRAGRLAARCEELEAENYALLHRLAEETERVEALSRRLLAAEEEIDRLRAENAELRGEVSAVRSDMGQAEAAAALLGNALEIARALGIEPVIIDITASQAEALEVNRLCGPTHTSMEAGAATTSIQFGMLTGAARRAMRGNSSLICNGTTPAREIRETSYYKSLDRIRHIAVVHGSRAEAARDLGAFMRHNAGNILTMFTAVQRTMRFDAGFQARMERMRTGAASRDDHRIVRATIQRAITGFVRECFSVDGGGTPYLMRELRAMQYFCQSRRVAADNPTRRSINSLVQSLDTLFNMMSLSGAESYGRKRVVFFGGEEGVASASATPASRSPARSRRESPARPRSVSRSRPSASRAGPASDGEVDASLLSALDVRTPARALDFSRVSAATTVVAEEGGDGTLAASLAALLPTPGDGDARRNRSSPRSARRSRSTGRRRTPSSEASARLLDLSGVEGAEHLSSMVRRAGARASASRDERTEARSSSGDKRSRRKKK